MEMTSPGDGQVRSRDPRTRILLVADEEQERHLYRRILERAGYACIEAGDAPEARRRLQEEDVSLLLVDASMSGEAGLELTWHVVAKYPAIPVTMVIGRDDAVLAEGTLASAACGYLVRPFTSNELTVAVANALCERALKIEKRAHREMVQGLVPLRTAALAPPVGA
jgi:DNA-binding NtrC family response regulator